MQVWRQLLLSHAKPKGHALKKEGKGAQPKKSAKAKKQQRYSSVDSKSSKGKGKGKKKGKSKKKGKNGKKGSSSGSSSGSTSGSSWNAAEAIAAKKAKFGGDPNSSTVCQKHLKGQCNSKSCNMRHNGPCKYFSETGKCKKGDGCDYQHVGKNGKANAAKNVPKPAACRGSRGSTTTPVPNPCTKIIEDSIVV